MSYRILTSIKKKYFDLMLDSKVRKLQALHHSFRYIDSYSIPEEDVDPFSIAIKNHIKKINDIFSENTWECKLEKDEEFEGFTISIQTFSKESKGMETVAVIVLSKIRNRVNPKFFEGLLDAGMNEE